MKRFLAILLVIAFCFGFGPILKLNILTKAEDTTKGIYQNYEYEISNNRVKITHYNGTELNVSIPNTINGTTVTEIGYMAFSDNEIIQNVEIPNNVLTIGTEAFKNCTNLETVNFDYNSKLNEIGNMAFYSCSKLNSIIIPDTVQLIYHSAFDGCKSLSELNIPNNIKWLGFGIIEDTKVTNITIPTSLTESNQESELPFNWLYSSEEKSNIPSLTIVFENGAKRIPKSICSCSYVENVIIPDTVETIEEEAFAECERLKSITIPKSVTNIDNNAFNNTNLTTIYGWSGSVAEQYANERHIPFTPLTEDIKLSAEFGDIEVVNGKTVQNVTLLVDTLSQSYHKESLTVDLPNGMVFLDNDSRHIMTEDVDTISQHYSFKCLADINTYNSKYIWYVTLIKNGQKTISMQNTVYCSGYNENYSWKWGVDNYSFTNTDPPFQKKYYLSDTDYSKLLESVSKTDLYNIGSIYGALNITEKDDSLFYDPAKLPNFLKKQFCAFHGSCHGMALSAALFKAKMLNPKQFGASTTNDLSIYNVESLINYYQFLQTLRLSQPTCSTNNEGSFNRVITTMYNMGLSISDKNSTQEPFLVSLNNHKYGHTVICFGAEKGDWTFKGKKYHKRLLIADCLQSSTSYIYISDDNNSAKYSEGIQNWIRFGYFPSLNQLNSADYNDSSINYFRLHTHNNDLSIESLDTINLNIAIVNNEVKKNIGDIQIEKVILSEESNKEPIESDCFDILDSSLNALIIKPYNDEKEQTSKSGSIKATLSSSNYTIGIEGVATSATVFKNGSVVIDDAEGELSITCVGNDSSLDFVTINGNANGDVVVTENNDQLLITGDYNNYSVSNMKINTETDTVFIEGDYDSSINVQGEKLLAHLDTDYNGSYETTIDSDSDYSLIKGADGKWAVYRNGKVDISANGIFHNSNGWWRVEKGYVNFDAQGIYQNHYGWWKTTNGKVTFKEKGVFQNGFGWWRVEDSKVNFKANGIYQNQFGWWKTTNGKVTFKENGVFQNEFGWWKVKDSKVDFGFTGIAKNKYGNWYIKGGKVDFSKNGKVNYNGKTYTIKNGKVV